MMKKLIYSGIVLGLLVLIQATSCNKDQVPVDPTLTDTMPCPDTVETLPPKTHKGINTAGCLVNGEVWVARSEEYFGSSNEEFPVIKLKYGNLGNINDPNFRLSLWRRFSNRCDTALSRMQLAVNKVEVNKYLPIRNSYVFFDSKNCLDFDKIPWEEHYIIVDYLDTINQIIAGRFAFTAINHCPTPDSVTVTDGRFDVKYEEFD